MSAAQKECPYCGGREKELKVIPFNTEEGVAVVCGDCIENLGVNRIKHLGVAELQKLDAQGYFEKEHLGFFHAIEGLSEYVEYMKGARDTPPFRASDILIVANKCSISS